MSEKALEYSAIAEITISIITSCIRFSARSGRDCVEGNRALQPLAFHCAGGLICARYVAVDKQIRGGTASAAIKSGPAFPAGRTGIDVLLGKLTRDRHIKRTVVHIA